MPCRIKCNQSVVFCLAIIIIVMLADAAETHIHTYPHIAIFVRTKI